MWRALLVVVGLVGCVRDHLVTCDDGRACPTGTVCDDSHATCVAPDQLTACDGLVDNDRCTFGTAIGGVCAGGTCLVPRCGDGVVEPGELCDDGNVVSGDGCANDCLSKEMCGDGFVDPTRDEACDDGNTQPGDGCDPSCQVETLTWMRRQCGAPVLTTFAVVDPHRERLVVVGATATREWDGTTWTCADPTPAGFSVLAIAYDPDRSVVVAFGTSVTGNDVALDWDGAAWTVHPLASVARPYVVTYDVAAHAFFGFTPAAPNAVYSWAAGTGRWTTIVITNGTTRPTAFTPALAYDDSQGAVVGLFPTSTAFTQSTAWTWNRATAKWVQGAIVPESEIAMVFDGALGELVAVGVRLYTLEGGVWIAAPDVLPQQVTALVYDAATSTLEILGRQPPEQGVFARDGTTWSFRPTAGLLPSDARQLVAFPPRGSVLALDAGSVFEWNGATWSALVVTGQPAFTAAPAAAYDPIRRRIVAYDDTTLAAFDGAAWTTLAAPVAVLPYGTKELAYDGAGDRLFALTTHGTVAEVDTLAPDGTWQPSQPATATTTHVVWDDASANLVAVFSRTATPDSATQLATDGSWTEIFTFAAGVFTPVRSLARGSLFFVGNLTTDPVWERTGDDWHRFPPPPRTLLGATLYAADPAHHEIIGADSLGDVFGFGFTSPP